MTFDDDHAFEIIPNTFQGDHARLITRFDFDQTYHLIKATNHSIIRSMVMQDTILKPSPEKTTLKSIVNDIHRPKKGSKSHKTVQEICYEPIRRLFGYSLWGLAVYLHWGSINIGHSRVAPTAWMVLPHLVP
jgi:hypothetical protein